MNLFDIAKLEEQLQILEKQTMEENFWNDSKNSSKILTQIKNIKNKTVEYKKIKNEIINLQELSELVQLEPDEEIATDILKNSNKLQKEVEKFEISTFLSGKYDQNNAIITIHPGAGGTESQDWAEMLYRMYQRYCSTKDFKIEVLDYLDGDVAGIKSVTFLVKGKYAYGHLKAEKGVHRLVRISPFDSSKRRHTSFASIDVIPELDDTIEIDIKPEDLRIDTYRASGAGGQHINKTDSAVRITHIPTGIVISCQDEKSQIKNLAKAMNELRSRIYAVEYQKHMDEIAAKRRTMVSTGDRSAKIRTYNYPQGRVTDHRINFTLYNLAAVMDGEIDEIIEKLQIEENTERLKETGL